MQLRYLAYVPATACVRANEPCATKCSAGRFALNGNGNGSTGYLDPEVLDVLSPPATRGDCIDGPRPCPHVTCRHHIATEVGLVGPESCSLDVADRGPHTLDDVGTVMGFTRERIRQYEAMAMANFKAAMAGCAERAGVELDHFMPWEEPRREVAIRVDIIDELPPEEEPKMDLKSWLKVGLENAWLTVDAALDWAMGAAKPAADDDEVPRVRLKKDGTPWGKPGRKTKPAEGSDE